MPEIDRGGVFFVALLTVSLCAAGGWTADGKQGASDAKPVPVTAIEVKKMDVPLEIDTFGQIIPIKTVSVQARVAALVKEVKVRDGQRVARGDLLFVLDKEPFAAAVAKAKATLARDTALADNAALDDKRQLALLRDKAISQDAYDSIHASYLAAAATRDMSEADLEAAELQLGYCEISSTLDGVIGRVEVKAGNLIDVGGKEMASINQLDPIRASFFVAETRLSEVRAAFASGNEVKVVVAADDGGGKSIEGVLVFIDNRVDVSTGTITLEAEFANAGAVLWPGQYVRIVLRLFVEKGALVVPDAALHATTDGAYTAAVIGPGGGVDMRKCSVKRRYGDLAVLESGLDEGEMAVLDGYLRLKEGMKAEIRKAPEADVK